MDPLKMYVIIDLYDGTKSFLVQVCVTSAFQTELCKYSLIQKSYLIKSYVITCNMCCV